LDGRLSHGCHAHRKKLARTKVLCALSKCHHVDIVTKYLDVKAMHENVFLSCYVVGNVIGVAQMDNIEYAVCENSSNIKTYTADTLRPLGEGIHVKGMRNPSDIVACRHDRQLYVADWDCIWRVSTDDHSKYTKWLTESTTDKFRAPKLSLTSQRLLVTSRPRCLRQYSTKTGQLLRVVKLSGFIRLLDHGHETTRGTFVVGHHGTSQDEWQCAVSINSLYIFHV